MHIVFSKEAADQLRGSHTVLELESVTRQGVTIDAYCVVSAEAIGLGGLPTLEHATNLHEHFITALKANDADQCRELFSELAGKFGGELDSFYEEILQRFNLEQSSSTT